MINIKRFILKHIRVCCNKVESQSPTININDRLIFSILFCRISEIFLRRFQFFPVIRVLRFQKGMR